MAFMVNRSSHISKPYNLKKGQCDVALEALPHLSENGSQGIHGVSLAAWASLGSNNLTRDQNGRRGGASVMALLSVPEEEALPLPYIARNYKTTAWPL